MGNLSKEVLKLVQGQSLRLGKKPNKKFESCVNKVKAGGQDIGVAHAICNKNVGKGKAKKRSKK